MKPQAVNVFGRVYKIVYREIEDDGLCHTEKALIEINNKLHGKELLHTLLHEYFHAVIHRISIDRVISDDVEELICDTFATFIVDNHVLDTKE